MPKDKSDRKITILDYWGLDKTQYDVDFFNCYINNDTPLFIDPWAIRCGNDDFSINCYVKIQSAFETLIGNIIKGDNKGALNILNHLHEPSETGLGLSKKGKKGSSVGTKKSQEIYKKLSKSTAIKSGNLNDLEDTALHIPGIGPDNVSDMVTNIIRYELIRYTKEKCNSYGIEMKNSTTKPYWDLDQKEFVQSNSESQLIVEGKKILLVPKCVLRRGLSISYEDFYNKGILEFEQSLHLDLRSSLCKTIVDDKGKIIDYKKPTKKSLKELPQYNKSRKLVSKYVKNEPGLIDEYKKKKLEDGSRAMSNRNILQKQEINVSFQKEVDSKLKFFEKIKPGKSDSYKYHDHIFSCLNFIFNDADTCHLLSNSKKEYPLNGARKRVDITFENKSNGGFFSRLSNYGGLCSAKIFFECKNYTEDVGNPEFDQMLGRFNDRESTLGFIICRNIDNKEKCLNLCKDILRNNRKYIIILTDQDIKKMLSNLLGDTRDEAIDNMLQMKLDEILSI